MADGGAQRSPVDWFHKTCTDYVVAQILFHMNQCGVMTCLYEMQPCRSDEIATKLGLNRAILETLMDYILNVEHLLERDDEDRYSFSEFGQKVIDRYGRVEGDSHQFNFFDVRVGAYGPVWSQIGAMLKQDVTYGKDFVRDGRFAENGVYKIAVHFQPILKEIFSSVRPSAVVEVGVNSGLVERLQPEFSEAEFFGLDKNSETLEEAKARASAEGVDSARWIRGDFFAPESWIAQLKGKDKVTFFTLHFHEFAAAGPEALARAVKQVANELPGCRFVALEQPRLPLQDRDKLTESLWLYSQSNILIHHLIGNGRILPETDWKKLFEDAGGELERDESTNYLGYRAWTYKF